MRGQHSRQPPKGKDASDWEWMLPSAQLHRQAGCQAPMRLLPLAARRVDWQRQEDQPANCLDHPDHTKLATRLRTPRRRTRSVLDVLAAERLWRVGWSCRLTFELRGRNRDGAWPAKRMMTASASRAKCHAGGGPWLERRVRPHLAPQHLGGRGNATAWETGVPTSLSPVAPRSLGSLAERW